MDDFLTPQPPEALNTGLLTDAAELRYVVHPPCHVRLSGRLAAEELSKRDGPCEVA